MKVGWKAVADDGLLALLGPSGAIKHHWGALMLHLNSDHTFLSARSE